MHMERERMLSRSGPRATAHFADQGTRFVARLPLYAAMRALITPAQAVRRVRSEPGALHKHDRREPQDGILARRPFVQLCGLFAHGPVLRTCAEGAPINVHGMLVRIAP
jgi:hypothetical protein